MNLSEEETERKTELKGKGICQKLLQKGKNKVNFC